MRTNVRKFAGNRQARRLASGLAAGLLMSAGMAMAAGSCFTIYAADGELIYRSASTPIDLSRPISETMAVRYPGAHLVWAPYEDKQCQELDRSRQRLEAGRGKGASSQGSGFVEVPQLRLLSEFKGSGGSVDAAHAAGMGAGAAWAAGAQNRGVRAAMR